MLVYNLYKHALYDDAFWRDKLLLALYSNINIISNSNSFIEAL